jgi:hypothetical protein
MKLQVESYSGVKANERPIKFTLDERIVFVESIDEQWYGPTAMYFRIHADDGNTYVIAHHESTDEWTLESFRTP